MKKSIYGMFWILSLVIVFLINNSISLAQSSTETTITQDDQSSLDIQQQNQDMQNEAWGTTYYYLSLKSIECIFPYAEKYYVFLKVNGKVVWGPEEIDEDAGSDLSEVVPIKVSKARIELYCNSTNSTSRATFLGKINLTSSDLKTMLDTGEKCYNIIKKYSWTTALYGEYDLCFEVNSTDDSLEASSAGGSVIYFV